MKLIFDIETDGLDANVIWCIVCQDIETSKVYKFPPEKIKEGLALLESASCLIGHNIIGFDIPVLEKLTEVDLKDIPVIDTLVLSRLFNPVRDGGHSLEVWGNKLQYPKLDFKEFESYTPEMLEYCTNDVRLNSAVYDYLLNEGYQFSLESQNLEHDVFKIMKTQEANGFKFDDRRASIFVATLREKVQSLEDEVHTTFKPKWVDIKEVTPKLKKDGELSKQGLRAEEYEKIKESGDMKPFMRQELKEFNLSSRQQIGEYLKDFGWKPTKFTPTGQPIVDEGSLSKIQDIPEAKLILEYLLLQKRIVQTESWIDSLKDDGRVHGYVIPNGTITGRMAHRSPNMAQVPAVYSPYGKECRSCWTVPSGYKLVGVDASQLELRMLAHYMADEDYINEIINGDIHTANQKLAGLESRDQAKTFIYALLYGAGDAKLGSVVGRGRAVGKGLRQRFFDNLPSFKKLTDRVQREAASGFVEGLDGRKLTVRSEHAALNTLLQGAGAIVMKKALIILDEKIKNHGYDAKFVANVHDEWQIECHVYDAVEVGKLGVQAIKEAGCMFNLNCPLDGDYKVGENWSETH